MAGPERKKPALPVPYQIGSCRYFVREAQSKGKLRRRVEDPPVMKSRLRRGGINIKRAYTESFGISPN
jgi:hypothetical protein